MSKQKTVQKVRGYLINCPNFEPCPLCYGCRSYDSSVLKCQGCAEYAKWNICDTKKHQARLLALMIAREVIDLRKG